MEVPAYIFNGDVCKTIHIPRVSMYDGTFATFAVDLNIDKICFKEYERTSVLGKSFKQYYDCYRCTDDRAQWGASSHSNGAITNKGTLANLLKDRITKHDREYGYDLRIAFYEYMEKQHGISLQFDVVETQKKA